ncbi:MAG: hypothetical protein ACSHXI_13460 [Hoeflea sp.]|uniref:hypothetical protein n=1 Tax=Hoeflea sp. TaxID=1940281 RepID=UPI003EF4C468
MVNIGRPEIALKDGKAAALKQIASKAVHQGAYLASTAVCRRTKWMEIQFVSGLAGPVGLSAILPNDCSFHRAAMNGRFSEDALR